MTSVVTLLSNEKASTSESKSNLLVGMMVLVGLLVLALATLIAWKLRREFS